MKRILALALVGGVLVLGGCARAHPPAAPAVPAAPPAFGAPSAASSSSSSGSVDSLLGDVDKQLNSDDQTPADQD